MRGVGRHVWAWAWVAGCYPWVDGREHAEANPAECGWYADGDGDGFGAPATERFTCEPPAGAWSHVGGDCDDGDPAVNPDTVWFRDADGDGLGFVVDVSVDRRTGCDPGEAWSRVQGDCDDRDATVGGPTEWYEDGDGDGYGVDDVTRALCAREDGWSPRGGDCNDAAREVNPEAVEVCDGQDDNCDGLEDEEDASLVVTWYVDGDGDGYGDGSRERVGSCTPPAPTGWVTDATDCADDQRTVNPAGVETCNGTDDDCDGIEDDAPTDGTLFYRDLDGDDYGAVSDTTVACTRPTGFVSNALDCADADPTVHPGVVDPCYDGSNQDCGAGSDDDCDQDGAVDARRGGDDCDDGDEQVFPGAQEVCNGGVDDDCDGDADDDDPAVVGLLEWFDDVDGDGHGVSGSSTFACARPVGTSASDDDCAPADPGIHPGAPEVCNAGVDDDCDGDLDLADPSIAPAEITWYRDDDGDGFGNPAIVNQTCVEAVGWVRAGGDCNDANGAVNPGATERCNGRDDDCDTAVDDADPSVADAQAWYADGDGDGYGASQAVVIQCNQPLGAVPVGGDCDPASPLRHPGAPERCNTLDDDCDGDVDDQDADVVDRSAWFHDGDQDGWGDTSTATTTCFAPAADWTDLDLDCDDALADVYPGATEVWYDGTDQDCDGNDDDQDGDGHAVGVDCDDTESTSFPGALDACYDGTDSDCGADSDFDCDGDGADADAFGGADCDDGSAAVLPGATEVWYDGVDADCAGGSDFDQDGDGFDAAPWGGDCADLDPSRFPFATVRVPADHPSLQVAIDTVCDGSTIGVEQDLTESVVVTGRVLTIEGLTPSVTVWGAGDSVVRIDGASVVTLRDLTVSGGLGVDGGGIAVGTGSDVVLSGVVVTGNGATQDGGGVYSLGTLRLEGCTISSNLAGALGGGLFADLETGGDLTVGTSVFDANESGMFGGGLWVRGLFALADVELVGNQTQLDGGGLYLTHATGTLLRATIRDNRVVNQNTGGVAQNYGVVSVEDSTIRANEGNGFEAQQGTVEFTDSVVSDNAKSGLRISEGDATCRGGVGAFGFFRNQQAGVVVGVSDLASTFDAVQCDFGEGPDANGTPVQTRDDTYVFGLDATFGCVLGVCQ